MKMVPLRALKIHLASLAKEAARGHSVQVTRYNKPYIILSSAESSAVHYGSKAGKAKLHSVLKGVEGKKWLEFLLEDRSE